MSMIDIVVVPTVLLAVWGIIAILKKASDRAARLKAMSDDELIDAINSSGYYDNQFRREYSRRHPTGCTHVKS